MKNREKLLGAVLLLMTVTFTAHALPPQAEADMLMIEAKAAMDAKNYAVAAQKFAQVQGLNAQLPPTFAYHYGSALLNTGEFDKAKQMLEEYITKEGAGGKYYRESLEAYSKIDAMRAEAQRKLEAAQAEEARKVEKARAEIEARKRVIEKFEADMVPIPGKNYAIGKYEVTLALYEAVTGIKTNKKAFHPACDDSCPQNFFTLTEINNFIQRLNAITGKSYRLPTHMEWQYACDGGDGHKYCGSNDLNSVGWYRNNSGDSLHPVGKKQPNKFGLYDMAGNRYEWVSAWNGGNQIYGAIGFDYDADVKFNYWGFAIRDTEKAGLYGMRLARDL